MPSIQVPVPDLAAVKAAYEAFAPGVMIVESVLVPLEPTPMGADQAFPIVPIDPTREPYVRGLQVLRNSASTVEIITVRYETPNEQSSRVEFEKQFEGLDEAEIAAKLEVIRLEARLAEAEGQTPVKGDAEVEAIVEEILGDQTTVDGQITEVEGASRA